MIGGLDDRAKKALVKRILQGDQGEALLSIVTTAERALVEEVAETHDLLGLEGFGDLPTPEDRKELLRELILAHLEGDLPQFWVENLAPIENQERAASFADHDDFEAVVERWAETVRESGQEGDDVDLADAVARARFGVGLEEFRELVVEWPEGREAAVLEEVIAGGVRTAHGGLQASNERLREIEDELPEPET